MSKPINIEKWKEEAKIKMIEKKLTIDKKTKRLLSKGTPVKTDRGIKYVYGRPKKVKGCADVCAGKNSQIARTLISHAYYYIGEKYIYILSKKRVYDNMGKYKGNDNRRFRVHINRLFESHAYILIKMLLTESKDSYVHLYYPDGKHKYRTINFIHYSKHDVDVYGGHDVDVYGGHDVDVYGGSFLS